MALTYLDPAMIEQPTNFFQLSAQTLLASNLNVNNIAASSIGVNNITNSFNVLGNLTVYGTVTALSGFNIVISSTTSTSALSVSNIQDSPALEVYQGPVNPNIAIFKNNSGTIATIRDTGITVNGILSTNSTGNSNLWNETYTLVRANSATWAIDTSTDTAVRDLTANWQSTYITVSSLSASWEESADILPTVTNYLSTSNVHLNSLTVTGNISATGTASVSALNIVSGSIFPKTAFNNLVSALAINVNGTTLYMPLLSAI